MFPKEYQNAMIYKYMIYSYIITHKVTFAELIGIAQIIELQLNYTEMGNLENGIFFNILAFSNYAPCIKTGPANRGRVLLQKYLGKIVKIFFSLAKNLRAKVALNYAPGVKTGSALLQKYIWKTLKVFFKGIIPQQKSS